MTKFHKCEVPGCGKPLTKSNTRIFHGVHPRDTDIGGRAERDREWTKQRGVTGLEPFIRINRKEKYRICKDCSDIMKENDRNMGIDGTSKFNILEKDDPHGYDSTLNLWINPKKVNITKTIKSFDSTFLDQPKND